MQLLISMISKNISKGHLSFTLPRQRPLRHRGLGMVFFLQVCRQFSLWAPVLVARSLFPFLFQKEYIVAILSAIRKMHSLVIAIAKCQRANIFPIRSLFNLFRNVSHELP